MQIHELNQLSRDPQSGDTLVLDTGEQTVKIDYNALADAIIAKFVPLAVDKGGTGATDAAGARTNLGAVNKAGDTITGDLTIKGGSWPTYGFKRSDGTNLGALWASANSGRVILRTWDRTGTYYVDYNLPDDTDNTANRVRYLLTTKEFPYTSKDQSSATMTGLVNGRGTWLVTALDGGDASKYYVGLIFHQDNNSNPVNTTLVNNGLNYSWGNTIGTCVFQGATGNYIVKAMKLTD